jgi:hypothetical protein
MTREEAEKHWEYTYKVIQLVLQLCHLLYVEAMLHGAKHQKEDKS